MTNFKTPNDPIALLLAEHKSIMAVLDGVRNVLPDLRSPEARARHLSALTAFGNTLAVDIPNHAHKEDDFLFPPLEAIIGEGGVTVPFREEHREIHSAAMQLSAVIRELNEVEHPAIVAGSRDYGAQLEAVKMGAGDLDAFVAHTRDLIDLLDRHFEKEETMLFPMAESILSEEVKREVASRMVEGR